LGEKKDKNPVLRIRDIYPIPDVASRVKKALKLSFWKYDLGNEMFIPDPRSGFFFYPGSATLHKS
jgi:hypothetical protein